MVFKIFHQRRLLVSIFRAKIAALVSLKRVYLHKIYILFSAPDPHEGDGETTKIWSVGTRISSAKEKRYLHNIHYTKGRILKFLK